MGSQVNEIQSMMVVWGAGHEVTGHISAALTSVVREQRAHVGVLRPQPLDECHHI